jgi:hypothetical protein
MVSEVSVQGWLAPLLLDLWEGRNITADGHGGGKLLTSWRKPKETGRSQE